MFLLPPLRILLPLVVATCALQASNPDEPFASRLLPDISRYSDPPSRGPGTLVHDWRLGFGRITFDMHSGTVVPLISGGRTVGFHFQGKASFSYRSEEELDRAPFTSNFNKNLARPTCKAVLADQKGHLLLSEPLSSFTVWHAGAEPTLPTGAPSTVQEKVFSSEWTYFQREGLGDRGQDFAVHMANTPNRRLVRAEITGEDQPFIYLLDEGHSRREQLWSVAEPAQPALYQGLRRVLLSEQPLGWSWKAPLTPLVALTAVDLDLKAGRGSADLKVRETLVASEEGVGVIALDLYTVKDRVFRQGIYTVARVTDGEGRRLPFHHRNDTLLVELAGPQPAGRPFTLEFDYGGPILLRPGGDNYWQLGVEPWFPQPDMGGQAYTVHAVIRTPKEDVPVAAGTTLRREQGEAGNLLEVRIDRPVQFFSLFAGNYSLTEERRDGLTIRVAAYANKGAGQQQRLIGIARQTIEFYSQLFEAFPFQEFNIVQVNQFGYGQAPPGMMIITNEAFNGKLDELSALFTPGINHRFAHEIAHQYWGHLVKMPTAEEQWITESFANYASALAVRGMKGQGPTAFEGLLSRWRNHASGYVKTSSIPMANRLRWTNDPYGSFLARTSLLYEKGALILAVLHQDMGDRRFALFMKSIIANFRWKAATTASIEQLAGMAGGKDYGPLFRDCYWGTGMPK